MELVKLLRHIKDEKVRRAIRVNAHIISTLRDYLIGKGFVEIFPVMISKVTDPLTTVKESVELNFYGQSLQLTKSMIFHKLMALFTFDKIFVFSPNIRLEKITDDETGRHLVEFVQLDVEIKNAKRDEVMGLLEDMLIYLTEELKRSCYEELEFFGRTNITLIRPFPRMSYEEAVIKYGADFESKVSLASVSPVWVTDFPEDMREFYYKTDEKTKHMRDFDLLYPEGFGEAVSGGEREDRRECVLRKLAGKGKDDILEFYVKLLEAGLPPSCGFGIGIERLTRYVCGLEHVKFTRLFPRLPGLKEFAI
ncbi:MAG: asparagine synthetase A [candidate division WOR-3 bacterium]